MLVPIGGSQTELGALGVGVGAWRHERCARERDRKCETVRSISPRSPSAPNYPWRRVSSLTHYVFRSVWHIQASLTDVTPVLEDLASYPAWWPEIRQVRPLGENRFEVVARSFLPYELRFVSEAASSEPRPGVLHATLSGDMEGTVRWTVEALDGSCRLLYDQEVTTHKRLLNVTAPFARPAFKANHAVMMRHGEAGLRTFMAGFARGASSVSRLRP